MITLPAFVLNWLVSWGWVRRPDFVCEVVDESPDSPAPGVLFHEIRDGHPKWLHLQCPRCKDHIQLQLAGRQCWSLKRDWLGRPTIAPSIWETESCQAHFFIRAGRIVWCPDSDRRAANPRF
jgi:hypothetical protein